MVGEKKLRNYSNYIFKRSVADQTEILFENYTSRLTRFANNYIHQNVAEINTAFQIRVIIGKKSGVASANVIDRKNLLRTLEYAIDIAKHQKENPDLPSLPQPQHYRQLNLYDDKTARYSSSAQARAAKVAIKLSKDYNLNGYGSFSTGKSETYVANSLGLSAYVLATDVFFNTVVMGDDSTGYADGSGRKVSDLNIENIAQRAVFKAILGRKPKKLKPGRYTVLLEPLATAELLDFLGWFGFNAKAVQEKRSFLLGKIGKKVMGKNITIMENPYHKIGFSYPFDFEGVPKRPVMLIENGIARGYVHDSITAKKENKKSTGNSLPAPNPYGPIPSNLVMKRGHRSPTDILRDMKRGLLVTRFHYTNILDPIKTVITGMTRDGLYLIKNGEIAYGVKNFRFTQSIIDALNKVEQIGKDLTLVGHGPGYGGRHATGTIVPSVKIRGFNFTGETEF